MKTLLLLRHAKSSWQESGLADHDRPLNGRGRKSASIMGKLIRDQHLLPETILCSTATRARQTCEFLREGWTAAVEPDFLAELYHCPPQLITETLRRIPESAGRVLLIGHNPGLEEFLEAAVGYADKFPTAALAVLSVDVVAWQELTPQMPMKLAHLWRPRDFD